MSDDLDDLRRETRKSSTDTITARFKDDSSIDNNESFVCRSQDISPGGLKLISHKPISLGKIVPIELDLGTMWAVIEAQAQIKWCLEIDESPTYYIGVKLVKIEDGHLQVWKKFVEKVL